MAVFRRAEEGIDLTLEVTVAPNAAVELRRVHLHNNFARACRMRLTSYGEVILAPQAADVRHPAFNKLFIESEYLPELNLQIFTRRPRSPQEAPVYLGHMLVYEGNALLARHEADRGSFIGRLHSLQNPAALESEAYLSGRSGATLDPIFCLGTVVELGAHENKQVCFVTLAAESREEVLALARQYQNWDLIEPAFHQASVAAQTWLGKQDINSQTFKDILQTLSALIYPWSQLRAAPQTIAANRLGQPGLWRFGISGDDPILLVEIDDPQHLDVIRETLQVYKYLRSRRIKMDLVLLNRQPTDYGAELNGLIHRLVNEMNAGDWLNQRGGIYILFTDQMHPEETTLLIAAARIFLSGENGALNAQLPGYATPVQHLPEFIPTLRRRSPTKPLPGAPADKLDEMASLQFFNGYGGFSQDGREYIIEVDRSSVQKESSDASGVSASPGRITPAPWVNVIGYPEFGFMVSEAGSQCTWAINSGENRLTPWSNDPVRDPSGEAIYLRDEETGEIWSPTPLPCGAEPPFRVTHGAGYTLFEHSSHGLQQQLRLFASPEDPVKILHLKVRNTHSRNRRITATYYVEWVLGTDAGCEHAFYHP